jgi:hypothetical protein
MTLRLKTTAFAIAIGATMLLANPGLAAPIAVAPAPAGTASASLPDAGEDVVELVATTAQHGTVTTVSAASVVPAPAALAMFGVGLLGLAAVRRLRSPRG